jgi:hypothetical protein
VMMLTAADRRVARERGPNTATHSWIDTPFSYCNAT